MEGHKKALQRLNMVKQHVTAKLTKGRSTKLINDYFRISPS